MRKKIWIVIIYIYIYIYIYVYVVDEEIFPDNVRFECLEKKRYINVMIYYLYIYIIARKINLTCEIKSHKNYLMAEKKRAYYKSHWLLAEALALAQATPPSSTCSSSTSSSCNSSVQSRRRQRENIIMHMTNARMQNTHSQTHTYLNEDICGFYWFFLIFLRKIFSI